MNASIFDKVIVQVIVVLIVPIILGIWAFIKKNKKLQVFLIPHLLITVITWLVIQLFYTIEPISFFQKAIDARIFFIVITNITVLIIRGFDIIICKIKSYDEEPAKETSKNPQIGDIKKIKQSRKSNIGSDIKMHKLIKDEDNGTLNLTWETFGKGIELLDKQMKEPGGIYPDVFFGVNEAGTIIASYLSFFNHRKPIGMIKTGGKKPDGTRADIEYDYPTIDKDPNFIAIVDSEVKSGNTTKKIMEDLQKKYRNENITFYNIVLGAVFKKDRDENELNINDFSWDVGELYKPDFIAFYIQDPGFEPPGGIR